MRISVFGLGYVGAVSGACLAELGHEVVGVDVDQFKVDTINAGNSPIVEELIGDLTADMVEQGRLRATTDVGEAIAATEMSLVCVGTPSGPDGGLDVGYVRRVSEQIGEAIRDKDDYHLVVVRSTVLPGTVDSVVAPALAEHSGKEWGEGFGVCFHPEFLREGSSVKDFRNPPKIVIGANDARSADMLAGLYDGFDAPLFKVQIRAAEMVKYADNAFHALKVVFGNEIGALCKSLDIDSHAVMEIFCQDTKLNISRSYLMPGFAYGGSCLPKDLRALMHMARTNNVSLPMLGSLDISNEHHLRRGLDMVLQAEGRSVALLGLSFKRGTDDLRESPLVELAERLLGKGYSIRIYDENVMVSRLRGGNKAYIEQRLPHIAELMVDDLDAAIESAEVVVIGANNPEFREALDRAAGNPAVIDLVRLFDAPPGDAGRYTGLCW